MLSLLLACASNPDVADSAEEAADTAPIENPYGDAEAAGCPVLEDGKNVLEVAGLEREIQLVLPDDPAGASVVFAWHWLGGTPAQTLNWMGIGDLADTGVIVVAPESTGIPSVEWDYVSSANQSIDVAVFDAMLICLWDQFGVDTKAVHTTGMSAGGLFTSFLAMHRSDVLASALPFSGGVSGPYYSTPERALPMMLVWGGASDTYGSYDFHRATQSFSELLQDDGHFVVECMHQGGHNPPDEAFELARDFFAAHPVGNEPWRDGLPDGLPAWCSLP